MQKLVELRKMKYPVILNVVCSHPDYSSNSYQFVLEYDDAMDWDDQDYRVEVNQQIREFVENEVDKYHFWHDISISIDYYFEEENSGLYKKYIVNIE